jgi:hypothetical protein
LKMQKIVLEATGVSERTVEWMLNERIVSGKFSSYTTPYKEEFRVSKSWLKQFQQCRYLNCCIMEQKWPSLKQIHTKALKSVNFETSVYALRKIIYLELRQKRKQGKREESVWNVTVSGLWEYCI